MSAHTPEPLRPVTGILPAARDRWVLLLVCALAGVGLGVAAIPLAPVSATATATVQVGPGLVRILELAPTPASAEDSVALAATRPVHAAIAEELGTDVDEVEESLTVTVRDGTSFIDFQYTAPTAVDAEAGADAASVAYLEAAQADAFERWQRQKQKVYNLIETAPATQTNRLRQQSQSLNSTIVDVGQIAQPAEDTAEESSLPTGVLPLAGGLAGLLLAVVAAYLLEARSPRLRRRGAVSVPGVRDLGALEGRASVGIAGVAAMLGVGRRLGGADGDEARHVRLGVDVMAKGRDDLVGVVRRQLAEAAPDLEVRVVPVDLETVDGLDEAASCDGIVLIGVEGITRVDEIDQTVARLDFVDAPCFGIATAGGRRWAASA